MQRHLAPDALRALSSTSSSHQLPQSESVYARSHSSDYTPHTTIHGPLPPRLHSAGGSIISGRRSRAGMSYLSNGEQHQVICALSEARGISPSVGVAFINVTTGEAILSQICDNQFFIKTTHKVALYEPCRILLIASSCPPNSTSSLYKAILQEVPGVPIIPLDRKYWSETAGLEFIKEVAFKEDVEAIRVAIEGKFYATSAFSAAMKYLELEFTVRFTGNSLRVRYKPCEDTMMIDLSAIHTLELIRNLQNAKSADSLFGVLNATQTPMGARMLRSNMLQPSTQQAAVLDPRFEAVQELSVKEDMFFQLRNSLKEFIDMEKVLTKMIILPSQNSVVVAEQALNSILMVKHFVMAISPVFASLTAARSNLLVRAKEVCRPELMNPISSAISQTINDDVTYVKTPLDLINQRTYAVKAGVHGFLDVARQTNKEATEDLHAHVEQLNASLDLVGELKFAKDRRYFLRFRLVDFEDRSVPDVLINCVRSRDHLECQTMQLLKFNQRIREAEDEVSLISDRIVQELLHTLRCQVPKLFQVCETIALLDMISAFAHLVTMRDYVRPEFKDALALKDARHPILDAMWPDKFVPNDCYATHQYRFQIVTGCNMSGKSTYIRAVALLQVMAQIGCFVPAQYASFTTIQNLFARVSMDDSIEANLSTFSVEMRDSAFILRNINEKSLAIVDELGRGTSTRDGLAIAIAISEALIQSDATVFFATHFLELSKVLADRPGTLTLHLMTETDTGKDGLPRMTMLYKIGSGAVEEDHYGIKLASVVGFPPESIAIAESVARKLKEQAEARKQNSQARKLVARRKLVLNLRETLQGAYHSMMDDETLTRFLKRVQDEFIMRMDAIENVTSERDTDGDETMSATGPDSSVIEIEDDGLEDGDESTAPAG